MLIACKNETGKNNNVRNEAFEPISIESLEDIDNYIIKKVYEIIMSNGKS